MKTNEQFASIISQIKEKEVRTTKNLNLIQ